MDTNPFPKLVDVDMITIDWTRKNELECAKKMSGNVGLTKVVHFAKLRLRSSIVSRAPNMAERGKNHSRTPI